LTGSQTAITVQPAAAATLSVTGIGDPVTAGAAATATVTALDGFGNVATGYAGTVSFTSTDEAATLPGAYALSGTDAGVHQFPVTLRTAGEQTVIASDGTLTGSQTAITVEPAAAASMTIQAGNDAAAVVGSSVATPPAVRVTDAFGNPVAGVAVNFAVAAGGGGVTDPAPVTNGEGIAAVTAWTMGSTTAMSDTGTFANALEATSAAGTVTFTARARYSYATHVQPIWNASCTGCHGAIAPALTAGASWGNLVDQDAVCDATFKRVALNGTSTAEAMSVLMAKLEGTTLGTCAGVMPPVTGPLPPATRDVVRAWIRNGAPNN
ncbi:MAG TPA: Ig-like domain-containing protein, partial [Gemmatimonadales bacterium]|nr:Ig-like domain-containing protein [Gemmatimonadales bacterium]